MIVPCRPPEGQVTGSQNRLAHPGTVTIAGRMSKDLAPGTWKSILRQSGLKTEDTP